MADITLTVQRVVASGLTKTQTGSLSLANTYKARNDGKVWLHVVNGGGSACAVSISTPGTAGGLAIADRSVSVPAGEERLIGPFPPSVYNDASGDVNVTFDFITSVTVAALHLG